MFIVEAVMSVMPGAVALGLLCARPTDATWLPHAERQALQERIQAEGDAVLASGSHLSLQTLLNPSVLLPTISYIGIALRLNTAAF